jgi:hypothetical protein
MHCHPSPHLTSLHCPASCCDHRAHQHLNRLQMPLWFPFPTRHENGGETISPEFLSPQLPLEVLVPAKTVSIPMRCSGPVCTPQASPASPSVNVHVRVGTESPTLHVVPLLPSTTVRDLKGLVLVRAPHGLLLGLGHWHPPHHAFTAL